MLTEIYIEALLVDEDLADQVWQSWMDGYVSDAQASLAWSLIAVDDSTMPATHLLGFLP